MNDHKVILVNYNPITDTGIVVTISEDDWIMENIINYDNDKKLNVVMNSEGHIAAVTFDKVDSTYVEDGLYIIKEN